MIKSHEVNPELDRHEMKFGIQYEPCDKSSVHFTHREQTPIKITQKNLLQTCKKQKYIWSCAHEYPDKIEFPPTADQHFAAKHALR